MSEPTLLVIAGCNGSGKSSFSRSLVPTGFQPFDYDIHYLEFYASLFDSDIREEMAHNLAFAKLENQIGLAISKGTNFCYETNFNSTPLYWPKHFKLNGYKLHLIYLCLDSIEEAHRRVAIRVENGGHFVAESEIHKRYYEGFTNLNNHYPYFDLIDIFDSSKYSCEPDYLLTIENGSIDSLSKFPTYLFDLIPDIVKITHK